MRNYLAAVKEPSVNSAEFSDAGVDVVGPDGGYSAVMYCEKEGFDPLFKAVESASSPLKRAQEAMRTPLAAEYNHSASKGSKPASDFLARHSFAIAGAQLSICIFATKT